jgi:membrane-associated protein
MIDGVADLVRQLLHLEPLIREVGPQVGYTVLFVIVFVETALFIGFFLPGDSLLLTAGLLASQRFFAIELLIPLLCVAAIAGDATGYWVGRRAGAPLFAREDSRFFKRRHLMRAKAFYDRHGGKAIILSRFMAVVRAFAPTIAGAVGMPWARFTMFNVVGGVGWVLSMTLLGYTVGSAIPNVDAIFLGITGTIIVLSFLPAIVHIWQDWRNHE